VRIATLLSRMATPLALATSLYVIGANLLLFQSIYLARLSDPQEIYGRVTRAHQNSAIGRLRLEVNQDERHPIDLFLDSDNAAHLDLNYRGADDLRLVVLPTWGQRRLAIHVESAEWSLNSAKLVERINRIRIIGGALNLLLLLASILLLRAWWLQVRLRRGPPSGSE